MQQIMESLGGGGHLNVAGAQIKNATLEEVKQMIIEAIDKAIEKDSKS